MKRFDANQDSEFAKLLNESAEPARLNLEEGEVIRATLVHISKDTAFFSLGPKIEGVMDAAEIMGPDGTPEISVGQTIWAYVQSLEGGVKLSKKIASRKASLQVLEDAKRANVPVEGKIEATNKGGFEVSIGATRAFCPISQIDLAPVSDPSALVGQTFNFLVTQISGGGKNVVVSRRALLERDKEQLKKDKKDPFSLAVEKVQVGSDLPGKVVRLEAFGAFIELFPGVQGLAHISEISQKRIRHPQDVLQIGDEVVVRVLDVDTEKQRISLSVREGAMPSTPEETGTKKQAPKTSFGTLGDLFKNR